MSHLPSSQKSESLVREEVLSVINDLRLSLQHSRSHIYLEQILCSINKIKIMSKKDNWFSIAGITVINNEVVLLIEGERFSKLSTEQQQFVILHEALHILNDRFDFLKDNLEKGLGKLANFAMDLPINERIILEFIFNLEIPTSDLLTGELEHIVTIENLNKAKVMFASYAYSKYTAPMVLELLKLDQPEQESKNHTLIGSTSFSDGEIENRIKTIKTIAGRINPVSPDKNISDQYLDVCNRAREGESLFYQEMSLKVDTLLVNKLISIAEDITFATGKRNRIFQEESWANVDRRFKHLMESSSLLLPGKARNYNQRKLKAMILIDVSGSCVGCAPKFIEMARAIPREYYDVYPYVFDTCYREINLSEEMVLMGGGTSYDFFGKLDSKIKPDVAFVFSDGFGTSCEYALPERWHWFIMGEHTMYIPEGSKIYEIADTKIVPIKR